MEKNKVNDFINQLQDLDKRIDNGDSDAEEIIKEINKIVNEISTDVELDVTKKSLKTTLKFINNSSNPDPEFALEGDSGFDLRANLSKDVTINQGSVALIPTGLYFEVEKGFEIQIRTRSGIAAKTHMWVLNSPGTIDSQYRGEIMIILANFDETSHTIRHGDRIAQAVVCPVFGEGKLNLVKVEKLSETVRNSGGFGHTGTT